MEFAKDGIGWELDLIVTHVVVNGVESGDDTTGIVQLIRLFHVVGCCNIWATLGTLSSLLVVLSVKNNADAGSWDKGKQLFFESKKLRVSPARWHTHRDHIVREDLRIRLQGRPLITYLVVISVLGLTFGFFGLL